MAYIYKKMIHGKPYYYLRVSEKAGSRVITKDIAYLGSDVSQIEPALATLTARYKDDVRKAHRNIKKFIQSEYYLKKVETSKLKENPYLNKQLLRELEAVKLHYTERFLKLDQATIKEVYQAFLIDFAFNTTSMEGNTITLAETQKLLREQLTPKNRTLREIYDLQNTEKVFFEMLNGHGQVDHDFITSVHDELLENIDLRKGYRMHDVRVLGTGFISSPAAYIKTDMDLLLKWLAKTMHVLHPFAQACIFHHKFEKIHPFSDGNGRTGRMLLNYLLLQGYYPPLIIRKSQRATYLDVLAKADKAGLNEADSKHYQLLVEYLTEEMVGGYWNNFLV